MCEQEEKRADHGQRVAEGDKVDAAFGIGRRPLGKRKLCRILAEDGDVAPTFASKALPSDL